MTYLILIQLVKRLSLNFLDRVKLAGGDVFRLVNLGVLLACTNQPTSAYQSQASQLS